MAETAPTTEPAPKKTKKMQAKNSASAALVSCLMCAISMLLRPTKLMSISSLRSDVIASWSCRLVRLGPGMNSGGVKTRERARAQYEQVTREGKAGCQLP